MTVERINDGESVVYRVFSQKSRKRIVLRMDLAWVRLIGASLDLPPGEIEGFIATVLLKTGFLEKTKRLSYGNRSLVLESYFNLALSKSVSASDERYDVFKGDVLMRFGKMKDPLISKIDKLLEK